MARPDLYLAVARVPFLKARERILLAEALGGAKDLCRLAAGDVESIIERSLAGKSWEPAAYLAMAERDAYLASRGGISFASYGAGNFPPLLRELSDPPAVLFFRGRLPDPERPLVAVVGTREPSSEGAMQSYEFGRDFGRCGVAVVSGLARGIDAMAHRGNVEACAPSVGVLGSGLDQVFPASNRTLARRMIDSGGALVGEYPPGEPPRKWNFPARNRIIAGLARSVVVIEAPAKSGALITADFALEQGRDLWVGSAGSASRLGEGTLRLAGEGASIAEDAYAIVKDWGFPIPPREADRRIDPNGVDGQSSLKTALASLEKQLGFPDTAIALYSTPRSDPCRDPSIVLPFVPSSIPDAKLMGGAR